MILDVYVDVPVKFEVEVPDELVANFHDEDYDWNRDDTRNVMSAVIEIIKNEALFPVVDRDIVNIGTDDISYIYDTEIECPIYEG